MDGTVNVTTGQFPNEAKTLLHLVSVDNFKKEIELLDKKISGKLLTKKMARDEFSGKEGETLTLEGIAPYDLLVVVGVGKRKDFSQAKLKNILASAFNKTASLNFTSVSLFYSDLQGKDFFEVGKTVSLGFYLSNYHFDKYKSAKDRKKIRRVQKLEFYLDKSLTARLDQVKKGIEWGRLIAEGIYLTRNLVNEPASHVHPETLAQVAQEIGKQSKGIISVEVKEEAECRKLGMGAYLGVAQGSEKKPKFIILHYKPRKPSKNKVCLVGKSITFDSGGLSLKPADYMMDMKIDMAGGATVLGVFKILSNVGTIHELSLPEIYGILPACENMPSGKALRPGDIVSALNGKTIEVLNTDAEGRLALADGLSYAEKYIKPNYLIDLATLTGACMVALGKDLTGMFGNDETLLKSFENICKKEGDELWPMPLYKPYLKKMKNEITDLKNIGGGRYGGAITAALFLSEFVDKSKWIHLDIAGPSYNDESPKGIIPKGGTGWGVASLIEWLRDKIL